MKKHTDILASNGTSYRGHYIITTAERLIDLFGPPQYTDVSCDGSQMEWVLNNNGDCITIYDRCSSPYRLDEPVRWHIGAHSSGAAASALDDLTKLVKGENFDSLWNNLKQSIR